MAFRGDSTGTYTFASDSTGGTVDLGARNNYRYVNAVNVYNKGKSDGAVQPTTIPYTTRAVNAGVEHTIIDNITAQNIFLCVTNSNIFTSTFPNSNVKIYLNSSITHTYNSAVLGSNPTINVKLTSRGSVKITATMVYSGGSGTLTTVGCYS